ncbi:hypothetical protein PRZ48_008555 [Zasmidium cellare]|uniref:Uncharacterized protein n=1 Tax=Zasmidium cellare TaxID=395010 RepID=A0ABR0EGI0_ZASCE|nr:hypothetical protein PRZ48_008555 [Zasmidium cellare]
MKSSNSMKSTMAGTPLQHRQRQRPSASRADQTPSYASPTIASRSKSRLADGSESPSRPNTSPRQHQPSRDFKTYSLSTKASRRRSLWQGPFRFLDLPADIRNIIYDFVAEDCIRKSSKGRPTRYASQKAMVTPNRTPSPHWPLPYSYSQKLPPLFLVKSKQIREEFGSYIFTQQHITFVSWTFEGVNDLFRLIGLVNCKRLMDNENAYLQIWHSLPISKECRITLKVFGAWSWTDFSKFVDDEGLWQVTLARKDFKGQKA